MQASRLLISTLAALGIAGLAVAQTVTTPVPGTTTTVTPPSATITTPSATTETTAQRMERERLERERMATPAVTGNSAPRDANGNLVARADRN